MNKTPVVEAEAHSSEILARVESGHDVPITRRGAPVARLSGVESVKRPLKLDAINAFREELLPTQERSAYLIRRVRDQAY